MSQRVGDTVPDFEAESPQGLPAEAGDSCQLTAEHKVATPVNWQHGDDVIILPAVSDEDAKAKYPDGWTSPKPYIRYAPAPR